MAAQGGDARPIFETRLGLAVIAVLREEGYGLATVEKFAARSGLSSESITLAFDGKAAAVSLVLDAVMEALRTHVQEAFESEARWPQNLTVAARAAESWLAVHPECGWLAVVGALDGPELLRARREETMLWAAGLIDRSRDPTVGPEALPSATSLFIVGSITDALRRFYEGSERPGVRVSLRALMSVAACRYLREESSSGDPSRLRQGDRRAQIRGDGEIDGALEDVPDGSAFA
ncbi:MAG TPA: hypothetical protein VGH14_04775 [Solirubrobacterales bacterium]